MTTPHKIIAELRKIRQQSRISQDAVALALGLHCDKIPKYELGRQRPLGMELISTWAEVLGHELVLRKK